MVTVRTSNNDIEITFAAPDSVLVAALEGQEWPTEVFKTAVAATITDIIDQYPPLTFDRVETVHKEPSRNGNHCLQSHVTMTFDEAQTEMVKAGVRWLSWVMIYTSVLAKELQEHAAKAVHLSCH